MTKKSYWLLLIPAFLLLLAGAGMSNLYKSSGLVGGDSFSSETKNQFNVVTTSTIYGKLMPGSANAVDIGQMSTAFRNIYASGTIYAGSITISQLVNEPLIVGNGSSSATINGSSTSTFVNGISLGTNAGTGLLVGGYTNTGYIWVGNGKATTTLSGGLPGATTSTLTGDTVINNAYMGTPTFGIDAGLVSFLDIPVSSSAATGTIEGYGFSLDSLSFANFSARSDASGSVWDKRFEISDGRGTATTSIFQSRNGATSTPIADYKQSTAAGQGSCLPFVAETGQQVYASFTTTGILVSTASCLGTDIPLTR